MYTKDHQEMLRERGSWSNKRIQYTVKEPVETRVVTTSEAHLRATILQGDRELQAALQDLRHNIKLSSQDGYMKAQFNHSTFEV